MRSCVTRHNIGRWKTGPQKQCENAKKYGNFFIPYEGHNRHKATFLQLVFSLPVIDRLETRHFKYKTNLLHVICLHNQEHTLTSGMHCLQQEFSCDVI